jgi:hypothetical protein
MWSHALFVVSVVRFGINANAAEWNLKGALESQKSKNSLKLLNSIAAPPQPTHVDCLVAPWTTFTACSKTCGGGKRSRQRIILVEPEYGGKACPHTKQSHSCSTFKCLPVPEGATVKNAILTVATGTMYDNSVLAPFVLSARKILSPSSTDVVFLVDEQKAKDTSFMDFAKLNSLSYVPINPSDKTVETARLSYIVDWLKANAARYNFVAVADVRVGLAFFIQSFVFSVLASCLTWID